MKLCLAAFQVISSSTTVFVTIGLGYIGEPPAAVAIRYTLSAVLLASYCAYWVMHNQYYAIHLFDFLLRRGYMVEITQDVVAPVYLFKGGWNWYNFVIVAFLVLGLTYLLHFKQADIGSVWMFVVNSLLLLIVTVYNFRAPFDAQLMPLTVFVKSFDNGLLTRKAIVRAAEYLRTVVPVQGCVSVANPCAYTFLGLIPDASSRVAELHTGRHWGCQYNLRVAAVIVLSLLVGATALGAVLARALFFGTTNAFASVNTCTARCIGVPQGVSLNASSPAVMHLLCEHCICVCVQALNVGRVALEQVCRGGLSVASCSTADCPLSC